MSPHLKRCEVGLTLKPFHEYTAICVWRAKTARTDSYRALIRAGWRNQSALIFYCLEGQYWKALYDSGTLSLSDGENRIWLVKHLQVSRYHLELKAIRFTVYRGSLWYLIQLQVLIYGFDNIFIDVFFWLDELMGGRMDNGWTGRFRGGWMDNWKDGWIDE